MFLVLVMIVFMCNTLMNEGKGAVYSFDPVGSYQRDTYKAGGSASAMLQPLLDNQVTDALQVDLFIPLFKYAGNLVCQLSLLAFGRGAFICLCFQHALAQIGFKNMEGVQHVPLTQEKAVQLVKDVFISAAERDVYTGDALRLCVITKEGIREETVPLRKD